MQNVSSITKAYEHARQRYADFGVDTERAIETLLRMSLSIHCWQGDDVGGFEKPSATLSGGGILATGNYPGKARTIEELRMDLKKAYALIPGAHRLNLHAMYGDFRGAPVDRNEIETKHFQSWIDWAKQEGLKLDFNATCFSHPKADSGYTLSSKDKSIRGFWIEHVRRCRKISAAMGKELNSPCIHNIWIPDGSKDMPMDRFTHRALLTESLDEIFERGYDASVMKDSIESKLFGIGSEAFVVGSHEFYLGYALSRKKMPCLDMGHYHPTESVADKISALLQFVDELLLHVSRGIRWDSDHVVIVNDDLRALAEEIVRSSALGRVHVALDYFDASMNRVGAWVIGARATLKAFLWALLEPREHLRAFENQGNYFSRLALLDEAKSLPFGAVWDYVCLRAEVPSGEDWLREVQRYEKEVLSKR
ncbi:MAG: L-rhamnose isomerase [Ignavibacteria bacterium]|nr:L-rhamnose isomerase [Ignavibacteria bacterium]